MLAVKLGVSWPASASRTRSTKLLAPARLTTFCTVAYGNLAGQHSTGTGSAQPRSLQTLRSCVATTTVLVPVAEMTTRL